MLMIVVIAFLVPLLPYAREESVGLPAGGRVGAGVPGRGEMAAAYRDAVRMVREKCPYLWPGARVERGVARTLARLPRGSSEKQIGKATLEGTLAGLGEPKARMISAREYEEKFRTIVCGGQYSGIGVIPRESPRGLLLEVVDGLPAASAGIRNGDELIAVDGHPVERAGEALRLLRGEYHSQVTVTVRNERGPIAFKLRRQALSGFELSTRRLASDTMLVRVYYPGSDLRNELERSLRDTGVSKLIVDLRHSPSGYPSDAMDLLSLVSPVGTITFDAVSSDDVKHYKTGHPPLMAARVAVLVDHSTIGASEIAAAALRDQAGAVLLGMPTRGDALVCDLKELPDMSAFLYPVAVFRSPSGHVIHHHPLLPDTPIPCTELERLRGPDPVLQEALRRLFS